MQLTKEKTVRFMLAVGLQVGIILVIFLFKYSTLASGAEVLVRIAPVDPRDPLRGDYVTYRLRDLSRISNHNFAGIPTNGQIVYVPLQKTDNYWSHGGRISLTKPADDSILYIKGRVGAGGEEDNTIDAIGANSRRNNYDLIDITYGVEDFFIPEGSGRRIPVGEATALIAVDSKGNAVLKQVYIDGTKWP